jgi:NAD kinase
MPARGVSVNSLEPHQVNYTSSISLDMVFVLGGYGTSLKAALYFAYLKTPIIGVNLGTVGFLGGWRYLCHTHWFYSLLSVCGEANT